MPPTTSREPLAVGVARAALARDARSALRLLEDRALGGNWLSGIVSCAHGSITAVGSSRRGASGGERHAASTSSRGGLRGAEVGGDRPPRPETRPRSSASTGSRRRSWPQRPHARRELVREARSAARAAQLGRARASPRAACAGLATAACRLPSLWANAPAATWKSVTSDLSCRGRGRAPRRWRRRADVARQVAPVLAAHRVGDDRRVAVGGSQYGIERLKPRAPAPSRRLAVLAQEHLEVVARVGLQRGQHLVELHRGRGLLNGDRGAVLEFAGGRRARRQVDEEVALEEDARADLGRRVGVHGPARVLDPHRHERALAAAVALDGGDLADLDAGDPHRRAGAQVVRALERRLDLVVRLERDRLRPAEVDDDGDHAQRDDPDERVRAPLMGAPTSGGRGRARSPARR